jgi:ankyrin repeat protein
VSSLSLTDYATSHRSLVESSKLIQRRRLWKLSLRGGGDEDSEDSDENATISEDEPNWDYTKFGLKPPPVEEDISLNPEYMTTKGDLDYLVKDTNIGRWGWTALHCAAIEGDVSALEKMISMGGDVNAQTQNGWTPLHEAASWGKSDCARALIANGANASATTRNGWTALHFAAGCGHGETIKLLLAAGVDCNYRDNYGDTALDKALRNARAR